MITEKEMFSMPHPDSKKHPRMSMTSRAAQFMPFAALTGYDEAVAETARWTDEEIELEEDERNSLDEKLQSLRKCLFEKPTVKLTCFCPDDRKEGGSYVTVEGVVKKIDETGKTLVLENGTEISFQHLRNIEVVNGDGSV